MEITNEIENIETQYKLLRQAADTYNKALLELHYKLQDRIIKHNGKEWVLRRIQEGCEQRNPFEIRLVQVHPTVPSVLTRKELKLYKDLNLSTLSDMIAQLDQIEITDEFFSKRGELLDEQRRKQKRR